MGRLEDPAPCSPTAGGPLSHPVPESVTDFFLNPTLVSHFAFLVHLECQREKGHEDPPGLGLCLGIREETGPRGQEVPFWGSRVSTGRPGSWGRGGAHQERPRIPGCIGTIFCSKFSSVTQSCPTLCDPINCSTPGLPVHHQLP